MEDLIVYSLVFLFGVDQFVLTMWEGPSKTRLSTCNGMFENVEGLSAAISVFHGGKMTVILSIGELHSQLDAWSRVTGSMKPNSRGSPESLGQVNRWSS